MTLTRGRERNAVLLIDIENLVGGGVVDPAGEPEDLHRVNVGNVQGVADLVQVPL